MYSWEKKLIVVFDMGKIMQNFITALSFLTENPMLFRMCGSEGGCLQQEYTLFLPQHDSRPLFLPLPHSLKA